MSRIQTTGFIAMILLSASMLSAQTSLPVQPTQPSLTAEVSFTPVTLADIAAQRKAIESSSLEATEKQSLIALCDQAENYIRDMEKCRTRLEEYDQNIRSAPMRRQMIESELAKPPLELPQISPKDVTLEEAERRAADAAQDQALASKDKTALDAESVRRVTRRSEIPANVKALRTQMAEIASRLKSPPTSSQQAEVSTTHYMLDRALYESLRTRVICDERELDYYEKTSDLAPLEKRFYARRLEEADKRYEQWRQVVNTKKQTEARQETEDAVREEQVSDPAFKSLTEENRKLAETAESLVEKISKAKSDATSWKKELDAVSVEFLAMQERVRIVGLTDAIGALMRSRLTQLPDLVTHRTNIHDREQETRDVQFALFKLEDQRSQMLDLDSKTRLKVIELSKVPTDLPYEALEEKTRKLLDRQTTLLDTLIRNYEDYLTALVNVDQVERQLVDETAAYRQFIDQRVLWIPSAAILKQTILAESLDALVHGVAPKGIGEWREPVQELAVDSLEQPLIVFACLLVLCVWALGMKPLSRENKKLGEYAERSAIRNIGPTWAALAITFARASLAPAICFFIAWRLGRSPGTKTLFSLAISETFYAIGWWVLVLSMIRGVCRRHGLGESHFAWPKDALLFLRRRMRWLLMFATPLLIVVVLLESQGIDLWSGSLGRICFIAFWSLIMVTFWHLFRQESKFIRSLSANNADNPLVRMRFPIYVILMLIPILLVLLAFLGYYYSSYRLMFKFGESAILLLSIILFGAILSRWVMLVRRRRAMTMLNTMTTDPTEQAAMIDFADIRPQEVPGPDLTAISSQTRRLLNSVLVLVAIIGMSVIWQELFPAFNQLDTIPIWPHTATESITSIQPDGTEIERHLSENVLTKISVADVIWAVAITVMTFIASSNLPGLLQIAMPPRLPLDSGARYAICTLSRYVVVVFGVIMLASAVGIQWNHVQWLVAAVGVGLGFGLQEIFANFVSGLILLFERPIRVGDTVTIGDISGIVTRIQIRATTITNWDRKDFIVPNKEFVTGRLLNWTRSDPVNRLVLEVSVAYGSDMDRVKTILMEILRGHKDVMDSPSPIVTFESFGDSGLLVVMRCFLERIECRLRVRHQLNTTIHQRLQEEGISIPFPQRDVHVFQKHPAQQEADLNDTEPLDKTDASGENA